MNIDSDCRNAMGYPSSNSNKNKVLRDLDKVQSTVAKVLTKLQNVLNCNEDEVYQFYDFIQFCFYPFEMSVKCSSNEKNKIYEKDFIAPWITAWVGRAGILQKVFLITILLRDEEKSKFSLIEEFKKNTISFERFKNGTAENSFSSFEEFVNKYKNEKEEIKNNPQYEYLMKRTTFELFKRLRYQKEKNLGLNL